MVGVIIGSDITEVGVGVAWFGPDAVLRPQDTMVRTIQIARISLNFEVDFWTVTGLSPFVIESRNPNYKINY